MKKATNIHPIFDQLLQRKDKEAFLQQHSIVLWMTGLSGSGKSTIAKGVEKKLHEKGVLTKVLDGDNIRSGINSNLGFSDEDRRENIRRIAEVAKLFLDAGIVTICSFVSPTIAIRQVAKDIIGEADFKEAFVNASLEACEARDVKGLYKKARAGAIKNFTGIDAPFEAPIQPALDIPTESQTVEASVDMVVDYVLSLVKDKA